MKLVPWDHDISKENFDGLFLSNGPGDPALASDAIRNLRKVCGCAILCPVALVVFLFVSLNFVYMFYKFAF